MSTEPLDLVLFVTTDTPVAWTSGAVPAGLLPTQRPEWVRVDEQPFDMDGDWAARGIDAARRQVVAAWERSDLLLHPSGFARLRRTWQVDIPWLVDTASRLPMSHLSTEGFTLRFGGPRFGHGHESHGFACAFQGDAGHARVVSRRWLDHGPWATLRGPDDTTWVLFYDPEADEDAQVARAEAGHRRMGISDEGGFIQQDFVYTGDLEGFYDSQLKRFKRLYNAQEPRPVELLELCACRAFQALGPDRPVERLACVFTTEDSARRWLPELWLREIECYAIVQGKEQRLDLDAAPPPKPEWARALEQRYQPRIDAAR